MAPGQVISYFGVPFAKPPVGHLRFKPPVMHSGWNGTYKAFEKKLPCWQAEKMKAMLRVNQFTEDCLVMNINAPISPGLKPVLVNIHGGAFNSLVAISAPKLAEAAQVIFVAPQYRLGVLGFLATESPPPNLGMQDQAGGQGKPGKRQESVHNNFIQFHIGHIGACSWIYFCGR